MESWDGAGKCRTFLFFFYLALVPSYYLNMANNADNGTDALSLTVVHLSRRTLYQPC